MTQSFQDYFEHIKEVLSKYNGKNVGLADLYRVVDLVMYSNLKNIPPKNKSYYEKHSPIIRKLEAQGFIIPVGYGQTWKVNSQTQEVNRLQE